MKIVVSSGLTGSKVKCEESFLSFAYHIKCFENSGNVLLDRTVYYNIPDIDPNSIQTTTVKPKTPLKSTDEDVLQMYARDYLHNKQFHTFQPFYPLDLNNKR